MMKRFLVLMAVCVSLVLAQSPLTITTASALPVAVTNQPYSAQISATGGSTPYTWRFQTGGNPSARFTLSANGLLSGTPTSADLGVQVFTIQVTDANNLTVSKQFSVTVQSTAPLTLNTTAFTPGVVGIAYSLQLTGSGGTLPYKWGVLPAIVTFPVPGQVSPGLMLDSATGLVSGYPTVAGSFSFTITLTDAARGSVSVPFTISITAGGPLVISTVSLPNGTLGAAYSQTLLATGGVPPYTWSIPASTLPPGLALAAGTGVFSGAPLQAGTFSLAFTVTDSATTKATAKQTLPLTVTVPPALTITTSALPDGTQGAPYSQKLAATGGVPPYRWTLTAGALPAGLSLAADTGVISGNPTSVASSTFTVQATDSAAGTQAKIAKALGINIAKLTQVLLKPGAQASGMVGVPYSQTLPASGGALPYAWNLVAGSLPPGLRLNGAGTLSGTPSAAGGFGFTAQVVDAAGGSSTGAFSVAISSAPLSLAPLTLPSVVAGTQYPAQILNAAGGAPPYTFSIVQGTLPQGMTLANGILSGTPVSTGTAVFSARVTDSAQQSATSPPLQLVVRSSLPADLVISAAALSFTLAEVASDLPEPQQFTVASSAVGSALNYQVTVSPVVPWLSASGGFNKPGNTPGGISVALTAQALTLTASATPYTTVLSVTCLAPATCAGSAQKVNVSLLVTDPPPELTLNKSLLTLAVGDSGVATGVFGIRNTGGDTITVSEVSTSDASLTLGDVPAKLPSGPASFVVVSANVAGRAPGLYRGFVKVVTSAGTERLPVTLLVSKNVTLKLNPSAQQLRMTAGGAVGNPNGSVQVQVDGGVSSWSAVVLPGANWLRVVTAAGSSTGANPASFSYSIDTPSAAALGAGTYHGRIRVTSGQAANSPLDFVVVLNVLPASSGAPDPDLQPAGLVFISNGSAAIPPQSITLYASSTQSTPYQSAAVTSTAATWLSVSPTSGNSSASSPAHPVISVSAAGLATGVYRGVVTYQFSPTSLRSVNVTFIVPPSAGGLPFTAFNAQAAPRAGGNCAPAKVVATAIGLPSQFSQPVAWPTPLAVLLTDDCGTPVANGRVDATFDNGDPALPLSSDPTTGGRYAGTWIPRGAAAQVTITANASAPGLASARTQISGQVSPNAAPALTPGGMLNVFNPVLGGGIAPGMAVQIYGANLAAPGTSTLAASLPFPTTLSSTSVFIGGIAAPLYFVSPGQINAQAPFELLPGVPYQVLVSANGAVTTPDSFVSAPGAPGIAAFTNGSIIAQHLDFSLITDASPAKPGEVAILYLAGLGSAANQPATGSPAPLPPTGPVNAVSLSLNGTVLPTLFVGLTPGTVGLYQIAFTLPADVPDGNQMLTVSQAGAVSNVTIVPVKR